MLLLASHTEMEVAIFDHEGNLLDIKRRRIRQQEPSTYQERDTRRARARKAWLKKLGFQSATIKVKRFRFSKAEGISDFLPYGLEAFNRPDQPEREHGHRAIERWLADGQFVYDFGGGNCFLDQTGEVTDT
jgi:hypothetical protein